MQRHWTPDRMRIAIPADKVLSGSFAATPRKRPEELAPAQQIAPPFPYQGSVAQRLYTQAAGS